MTLATDTPVRLTVEADITGDGTWVTYKSFEVSPGEDIEHDFQASLGAYGLRFTSSGDATVTAWLKYQ
jgi:hypothetical protein